MRVLTIALIVTLLASTVGAYDIEAEAKSVLYQNSYPYGIIAGSTHFSDLWARDALYASWGALKAQNIGPVKGTLNTLSQHQSSDGQIPLRVGRKHALLSLIGIDGPTGPVYTNDKGSAPAIDPNCLYVITMDKYLETTGGRSFADNHRANITEAMRWLASHDRDGDGLIEEGPYASWDDSVRKDGASLYSNACYYGALRAAADMTGDQSYDAAAERTRKAMDEQLWNPELGYYRAWEESTVMDVPGNLFAIEYGIADGERAEAILRSLDEFKRSHGHDLPKTNYPEHRARHIYFPFQLIGMGDYHDTDGPYWPWIAALEAKVRRDQGQVAEADSVLDTVADWSEHSGGFHETYDAPREPLDRLVYDSEEDFSWSAGMILYSTADRS